MALTRNKLSIEVEYNAAGNSLDGLDTHTRTDFSTGRELRNQAIVREIQVVIIV